MANFEDVSPKGDGSLTLKVDVRGQAGPCPGDLAICYAHYRFVKQTAKGEKVKDGTKQVRDYVPVRWRRLPSLSFDVEMPTYKFKTVEDDRLEPRRFVLGEGEVPECVEFVVRRQGAGGRAVLRIAEDVLPDGRPPGAISAEVSLVKWEEPFRGPGASGWAGLRSVTAERMAAEDFLCCAEETKGRVEALRRLRADWILEEAIDGQASLVAKNATRAARRFRRAGAWMADVGMAGEEADKERVKILTGLAQAEILEQKQLCGSMVPGAAPEAKKANLALLSARALAVRACRLDPQDPMAQAVAAFAYTEIGDFAQARGCAERALALDPRSARARSELARVNAMEKDAALRSADQELVGNKDKLAAIARTGDVDQARALMKQIAQLIEACKVSWDACWRSKVGKTFNDIRRTPPRWDQELPKAAEQAIKQLKAFAGKKCRQVI